MKPSEVMKIWFQRVWCDEDCGAIDEMLHPEGKVHGIGPDPLVGRAAFKAFWDGVTAAFEENTIRVVSAVDEGDTCYVLCEGDLVFHGKPVTLRGGSLCRVENDLITEAWNYWDFVGCMAAMGAIQPDAFERACAGERFAAPTA